MQIKANTSGPSEGRAFALGTSVFTLGVTVGAYWEIFQWFFVGKYTMADTVSDLLVDSGGALAAALVALALRRSGIASHKHRASIWANFSEFTFQKVSKSPSVVYS